MNGHRDRFVRRMARKLDRSEDAVRAAVEMFELAKTDQLPELHRTSTTTTYDTDFETQGRIRDWKRQLAASANLVNRLIISQDCRKSATALALKTSTVGRSRAFAKLHKKLSPHAVLQAVELTQRPYFALWLALKPRSGVTNDELGCVTVDYILAGVPQLFCTGYWTLEVPDHALGRMLQRAPHAALKDILVAAHRHVLQLATGELLIAGGLGHGHRFWIPAAEGSLCCSLVVSTNKDDVFSIHVRVHTWISPDMKVTQGQPWLPATAQPPDCLGSSWLLPLPLRNIRKHDNELLLERLLPTGTAWPF